MAHYAFLDENNIVTSVIVGLDETEDTDMEQAYSEVKGQVCKRTSYNTQANTHRTEGIPFRKNYAGVGYSYSEELDAFIPPRPFASWLLDEATCTWSAPVPYPSDGKLYLWNESVHKTDSTSGWVAEDI